MVLISSYNSSFWILAILNIISLENKKLKIKTINLCTYSAYLYCFATYLVAGVYLYYIIHLFVAVQNWFKIWHSQGNWRVTKRVIFNLKMYIKIYKYQLWSIFYFKDSLIFQEKFTFGILVISLYRYVAHKESNPF